MDDMQRRIGAGPWIVSCPQLGKDATLTLDRWQNQRQTEMMERVRRNWKRRNTEDIPVAALRDQILPHVLAYTVVLGMQNVYALNGTPLEDTAESRKQLLRDFPLLLEWVFRKAQDPERAVEVKVRARVRPSAWPTPDPEDRPVVISRTLFHGLDFDAEDI